MLIYIYLYISSSTDRSVSFYQNSSVWLDILASRCWERNQVDSNANPGLYTSATRNQWQRSKFLDGYESQLQLFTYIRLTAAESSIHIWRALQINANGNTITSFARELNPTGVWEYIYIYNHPQTNLFRSIRIYIYIYICVCVYVCVYVCICELGCM